MAVSDNRRRTAALPAGRRAVFRRNFQNGDAMFRSLHMKLVLILVKLEDLSIDGLQQLIQTIGMAKRRLNYNLEIEGILFTIVEANTVLAKNSMEAIRDAYGEHVYIYDSIIPKSIKAAECPGSGMSIYRYDPKGKVAQAYEVLTREVLSNV